MSPDQSEWAAWAASVKTDFADVTKNDAFDEVVAAWDEPLCCQTEQSARPCRNAARWLALGPCHHGTVVCTFHKNRYVRDALVRLAVSPRLLLRCRSCNVSSPFEHFVNFRQL
jgi:hypothetical protein